MSGKLYHRIKKVDGKWTWRPCLGELCLICDGHMDTRNDPINLVVPRRCMIRPVCKNCGETRPYKLCPVCKTPVEEEFVQTGNGTVAQRLQELEEEE